MTYYRKVGEVPRKRHLRFVPEGTESFGSEELMGTHGFSQSSSLLYHRYSPSAIVSAEPVDDNRPELVADAPLLPRHLRTGELPRGGDVVSGRQVLMGNDDVAIAFVAADADSSLYRNAVGDELVYVQSGRGRLESVFGTLDVGAGDYVVIPMSATVRWVVTAGPLEALILESAGHLNPPQRYLNDRGQFVEGSPYSERDLRGPNEVLVVADDEETDVLVRHRGGLTRYRYAHHPFDVIGWDGTLYPFALSIHDFEPIVGAIHQPPPVHQTFEGPNLVVCSFVPRPFDFYPGAIKVPYHHANVDSDEVLFYSAGNFMSRSNSGIGIGSISMHPAGFVHGPQPGSLERAIDADRTEELAVMIDTFHRLKLTETARAIAAPEYAWTWAASTNR